MYLNRNMKKQNLPKSNIRFGKLNKPENGGFFGSFIGKVSSRTGASITFALLLFLVCAVVGSVVLVSGTSAAGRLSKIAEYDQRYYAVTSTAQLLADKLDNYDVTVVQSSVQTVEKTAVYTYDSEGVVTSRVMEETSNTVAYKSDMDGSDGKASASLGQSLLRDAALYLIFDPDVTYNFASQAAYESNYPALSADKQISLSITHAAPSGISNDPLAVDAVMTIHPSGDINIKLSNAFGSDNEKYQLTLVLKAETKRDNSNNSTITKPDADSEITVNTSSKTTVIKWTVKDIY